MHTNLDEMLGTLEKLADEVIGFYLSKSCPCAFPRYRFLVGFNGDTYSKALLHTFDTNVFVSKSIDYENGFLIAQENEEFVCRVCGSKYRYKYDQYSITFEKISLSIKTLNQKELGATAGLPFPLFGGVYFTNGAWDEEQNNQEFAKLLKEFPQASPDEFKSKMQELSS